MMVGTPTMIALESRMCLTISERSSLAQKSGNNSRPNGPATMSVKAASSSRTHRREKKA